jgi:hypothetical protein
MTQQDWFTAFRDVSQNLAAFLPAMLGAAVLVLVGWLFGRLLAWASRRTMISFLARLPARHGRADSRVVDLVSRSLAPARRLGGRAEGTGARKSHA